jgi:hypothetical protein
MAEITITVEERELPEVVEVATGIVGPVGPPGPAGPTGPTGPSGVWVQMTQAQYDALPSTTPGTLYVIVG